MCGFPIPFWTLLIMLVIVGAVVFKLRSWFKRGSPLLEELRDGGHEFTLFVVICLGMVFAAVTVAQTIHEHNDKITAFFASVRKSCEPEPQISVEEAIRRLQNLNTPPPVERR